MNDLCEAHDLCRGVPPICAVHEHRFTGLKPVGDLLDNNVINQPNSSEGKAAPTHT